MQFNVVLCSIGGGGGGGREGGKGGEREGEGEGGGGEKKTSSNMYAWCKAGEGEKAERSEN